MIEKVNKFPLEKLYFLESKEFLDKIDKVYLKTNNTFKLNSYCLGISRQKYNNDNFLYLFNGLRGYYDVKTRYLKKPAVMQVKPPLSKKVYNNDFLIKKYRYSDLLIFSLNDFNRPTITLISDSAGNLYYDFPYRLIDYLNNKRHNNLLKNSYKNWRQRYSFDLRHVLFNFKKVRRFKKRTGFSGTKLLPFFILGHFDEFLMLYFKFQQQKVSDFSNLSKSLESDRRGVFSLRRSIFKNKLSFKRKKFHKVPSLMRVFFFKNLKKFKIKKGSNITLPIKILKRRLFFKKGDFKTLKVPNNRKRPILIRFGTKNTISSRLFYSNLRVFFLKNFDPITYGSSGFFRSFYDVSRIKKLRRVIKQFINRARKSRSKKRLKNFKLLKIKSFFKKSMLLRRGLLNRIITKKTKSKSPRKGVFFSKR